jgi:2OG-Fe(II) oxygenase superfamily
MIQKRTNAFPQLWQTHSYYELYKATFNRGECQQIIDLHLKSHLIRSTMFNGAGLTLRESDLFWIPRIADTEWIFTRLWNVVTAYNSKYGFEISGDIGQAQLTRYRPGQHYQWHMDLGHGPMSLRKITAIVELASKDQAKGGGLEIFYGESTENKVALGTGDVVMFPSFIMHRASMVESGTRWSFVLWLNGTRPLT